MKKKYMVLIILTLIGCSNVDKKIEKSVLNRQMIQVTIDSIEELGLGDSSEITFKLWGYDLYMADVSATLLEEYTYNLSKLPVTYGVDYKKKWDEKIKPRGSGEYGYYITLEGENKGGEKYKIDYEATSKAYFRTQKTKIEQLSGKIYIKEIK
ncbi:hypothetical protein [Psychrilyobacter sp.]|uniref:hypothetical protein n=1 Tax=Psychrilyobacter sp. TaxID=2586924 RepID=UPI0030159B76